MQEWKDVSGHFRLPGSILALYSALWSKSEYRLNVNVLELRAFRLTLLHLEQEILGQTVLIESNNMARVLYINKQGGVASKTVNDEVHTLYKWAIHRLLGFQAIY